MIRAIRAARFRPGDAVRVPNVEKKGHVRTPDYVKGKRGCVTGILGEFPDPESLAHGGTGLPEKPLYRVRFRQADVWNSYEGPPGDTLHVDIYEHWLEPVAEEN